MKTNKQIKKALASVTGGEWMPDRLDKPKLHHIVRESVFGGVVSVRASRYHKVISIKASEVK